MIFEEREEDVENALNRNALWAVVYGDIMSYLVVFFMMVSVYLLSKNVPVQMSMHMASEEFSREKKTITQLFSDRGLQQIARIELGESRMRMVLLEPVLFDSGSAVLKLQAIQPLEVLAEALRELPNPVQIEGHTDDRPVLRGSRYGSNWELSAARAFAVMKFMILQGIPPERLSAIGYGEFKPSAPNATPAGRSTNRRIEINLVRTKQ